MPTHIPYIAVSAFDILAIMTVIGALSVRLWVVPKASRASLHARLWGLVGLGLAALTASSVTLLVGRTVEMSQQSLGHVWHWLPLVLHETAFGHIWLIRPAVLVIMWTAWFFGRRSMRGQLASGLLLALVALIAFTRSATGHPADQGQWTFTEWMDWTHLIVGSIWAGSLLTMTVVVFPGLSTTDLTPTTRARLVTKLSALAASALATVLVTGIWSAFHYLGAWNELWYSSYGRILLVKIGLVLAAIWLGALNRFVYAPRIRYAGRAPEAPVGQSSTNPFLLLRRSVAIETVLLLAVLVTAAVLLHAMPPQSMRRANMASLSDSKKEMRPHLEDAAWIIPRTAERRLPISAVRYGVLDFTGRRPYSTGPSKLMTGMTSL